MVLMMVSVLRMSNMMATGTEVTSGGQEIGASGGNGGTEIADGWMHPTCGQMAHPATASIVASAPVQQYVQRVATCNHTFHCRKVCVYQFPLHPPQWLDRV